MLFQEPKMTDAEVIRNHKRKFTMDLAEQLAPLAEVHARGKRLGKGRLARVLDQLGIKYHLSRAGHGPLDKIAGTAWLLVSQSGTVHQAAEQAVDRFLGSQQ